jgi:AraC-like DNA-binding protein
LQAKAPAPVQPITPSSARVSVRVLQPFFAAAEALGVDTEPGLRAMQLSRASLEDPELRVSHAAVQQLLDAALRISGERDLGLLAAELALPVHLDVVEYVARAQPTAGKALASAVRYHTLLHDGLAMHTRSEDGATIWSVDFGTLQIDPAAYEFTLAVYVIASRRITGQPALAPREVRFRHAQPKDLSRHRRIFGCALRFCAHEYAIVLPEEQVSLPLSGADAGLAALLDRHADEVLQKLGRAPGLLDRVRELLSRDLASGAHSADATAKRLGMSARTLHRRLSQAGTSYRALVDEVRRELSLRYLGDPTLAVREVGHLLGFTTGPSFHRAFRRWTGETPSDYRETLGAQRRRAARGVSRTNPVQ